MHRGKAVDLEHIAKGIICMDYRFVLPMMQSMLSDILSNQTDSFREAGHLSTEMS